MLSVLLSALFLHFFKQSFKLLRIPGLLQSLTTAFPAACKGFRLFLPAVTDPGNTAGCKADQEDHQQRYKHWGEGPAPCMFQRII